MADDEAEAESPLEEVVAGVVVALTFLVGFGLLALGYPWFWVAFVIGFAGVLPATIGLVHFYESRVETSRDEQADALDSLREQYARGEIDETEFEERLELLLETESVSDAAGYAARREAQRERESA